MKLFPDAWVIVKITSGSEPVIKLKLLAGFHGSYLSGDSWRLNSGITHINETDNSYEVHGVSGSVYVCYKTVERMSGVMGHAFMEFEQVLADVGSIEVVPMESILEQFKE